MSTKQVVKKNISGMQVIKTLQLLLEDNYSMSELTEKLNQNEPEPIFNNSVVSKYINTCRYCGFDIPKIHNKYFVAKLPFGLNLTSEDLVLLDSFQKVSEEKLPSKPYNLFASFMTKLHKYSNKDIVRVEMKTIEETYTIFENAIAQKRNIRLMFKAKAILDCIPVAIVKNKGKTSFKVLYKAKERLISIDRITGIQTLGKSSPFEEPVGEKVVFKIHGDLAKRYTLREHETEVKREGEYLTISNVGEDKDELLSRLLRYDNLCELISPQNYREEMKSIIKNMLNNYGES